MLVYKFDKKGLFVGTDETELDPLESKLQGKEIYLLPPNATLEAPEEKEGFAPVWDGKKWKQVEDNRGKEYWLPEDKYGTQAHVMVELGAFPKGATFIAPKMPQEHKEAEALAQAKAERSESVAKIVVEVDGMKFDGDEDSQTRMARTITASQALGLPEDSTISWAMADTNVNKVEQVTIAQLSKALYLAGCKQSELWCKPYGVTGTTQTGLEYLNSLGQ